MNSFLKSFGTFMLKAGNVVTQAEGFGQLFQPFLPKSVSQNATVVKVEDSLSKIVGAIGTAEVMVTALNDPSKTGADKLKAPAPIVAQIIQQSESLAGKKPKDQSKFDAAVATITGGVADLLNSY